MSSRKNVSIFTNQQQTAKHNCFQPQTSTGSGERNSTEQKGGALFDPLSRPRREPLVSARKTDSHPSPERCLPATPSPQHARLQKL